MQEIASEFSNGCPLLASVRFRWLEAASGPSQREEATPSLTQHPARLGRGAQAPRCGPKPWSPPQLFSHGCAPDFGLYRMVSVRGRLLVFGNLKWCHIIAVRQNEITLKAAITIRCSPAQTTMFSSVSWKVAEWYGHDVQSQEGSYRNVVRLLRNFCYQAACGVRCTQRVSWWEWSVTDIGQLTIMITEVWKLVMQCFVDKDRQRTKLIRCQPGITSADDKETEWCSSSSDQSGIRAFWTDWSRCSSQQRQTLGCYSSPGDWKWMLGRLF